MKIVSQTTVPIWLALNSFLVFIAGHFALLVFSGADFSRDYFLFALSSVFLAGIYFSLSVLFIQGCLRFLKLQSSHWAIPIIWTTNFFLSTYFFWELLSQGKLGLSVIETAYLLPESFLSKGVLYTRLQKELLGWIFAGLFLLVFGFLFFFQLRKKKQIRRKLLQVPAVIWLVIFLICSLFNWSEPWICQKAASEKACVSISRMAFHRKVLNPAMVRWKRVVFPSRIDPQTEKNLIREAQEIRLTKKPNIYLVMIDSLRADVLTPQTTPHLLAEIPSQFSFSAISPSNCTHSSWYSIFSGSQPYLWRNQMIQPTDQGTLPIRILRNMGYKIHLITSQSLAPFRKKEKIFGVHPDSLASYTGPDELESEKERTWALSGRAVQSLINLRNQPGHEEGNVYVLALFATHWPYALGENFEPRFTPYMKDVTVESTLSPSHDQHILLQNRYLNSLSFVDNALHGFFNHLKAKNQWDNSVLFFLGDHGESFQPNKPMVHCSSLAPDQITTRLLVKFPAHYAQQKGNSSETRTSLDVFPTIFDLLGLKSESLALFEGRSLLVSDRASEKRPMVSLNGGKSVFSEMRIFDGELSGFFELDGSRALGRDLHVKEVRLVRIEKNGETQKEPPKEDLETMVRYLNQLISPTTSQEKVAQTPPSTTSEGL